MRAIALLTILPLGLLAACGNPDERATEVSDDLRADLRRAASGSVELASASGADSAVLSAVERIPARSPERASAPRPSVTHRHAVPSPTPEPTPEPAPAPTPASDAPEAVADAPTASDLPAATRPVPVSMPTGGGTEVGSGRGGDDDVGRGDRRGPIGVVIRGGGTGDDHCEIHTRGGRGGMGGIPTIVIGFPGRTGSPTFPGAPNPRW